MLDKKGLEDIVNRMKDSINETDSALVSEDMLAVVTAYNSLYDEYENVTSNNKKLEEEKSNLIKVNGRLFQKIGFDNVVEGKSTTLPEPPKTEALELTDIINEKGELI